MPPPNSCPVLCVTALSVRVKEENKSGFALLIIQEPIFSSKMISHYVAELLRHIQSIEAHLHMGMHFNMAVLRSSCMYLDKRDLDILFPICPFPQHTRSHSAINAQIKVHAFSRKPQAIMFCKYYHEFIIRVQRHPAELLFLCWCYKLLCVDNTRALWLSP